MTTTTYLWDELSDNVIGEHVGGSVTTTFTQEPGLYGNLVSQHRATGTGQYHFDARGDTRELTDAIEAVTDTKLYDAWGNIISATGTTETPFQFIGRLGYSFDASTSLNYVRARWYIANACRWASRDPLEVIGGVNRYLFVDNNPKYFVDPSGLVGVCNSTNCSMFRTSISAAPQAIDVVDSQWAGTCRLKDFSVTVEITGPYMADGDATMIVGAQFHVRVEFMQPCFCCRFRQFTTGEDLYAAFVDRKTGKEVITPPRVSKRIPEREDCGPFEVEEGGKKVTKEYCYGDLGHPGQNPANKGGCLVEYRDQPGLHFPRELIVKAIRRRGSGNTILRYRYFAEFRLAIFDKCCGNGEVEILNRLVKLSDEGDFAL
jgi:RHS repeat-associated protein